VIRLVALRDMSFRQAAEFLGISTTRVRSMYTAGMKDLRTKLLKRPDLVLILKDQPRALPKKGLWYLGCPFSHPDAKVRESRMAAVDNAYKQLLLAGHIVYSPLSATVPAAERLGLTTSWDFWRAHDLELLQRADGMVVLPLSGWYNSTGLTEELTTIAGKKPAFFMPLL